jgi:AraC family transcriptional regulator of adaptative response / DNA-3-methyladenine glycosylase II
MWAILGQQVNLRFAYKLRNAVTRRYGVELANGLYAPPNPEAIIAADENDLRAMQFSGAKARYLIGAAKDLGPLLETPIHARLALSATRLEKQLNAVHGIGTWTTNYVMMRALGFADCLPIGDTGLTSGLQRFHSLEVRPGADDTVRLMAALSPHRSLATFHIWQSLGGAA